VNSPKFNFMGLIFLVVLAVFGAANRAEAETHYISPFGSASWANSTNINTPGSLTVAFSNAIAGDLVYLRGGTYNFSSELVTTHSGTGDADGQRVVFRAYPGETPDIVNNVSDGSGITVENAYWWLDGITMHTTLTGSSGDRANIRVSYNRDASRKNSWFFCDIIKTVLRPAFWNFGSVNEK